MTTKNNDLELTATQLRNARKRRAKQKKQKLSSSDNNDSTGRTSGSRWDADEFGSGAKRHKRQSAMEMSRDPSRLYSADPYQAPLVKAAQAFFARVTANATLRSGATSATATPPPTFPVRVGDTLRWRTVAKLAVRNSCISSSSSSKQQKQQQLTIGLFQPGTHNVIPAVPERDHDDDDVDDHFGAVASVHHPAIDQAIRVVQEQARALSIVPYAEVTGLGQLRHVALAVQRHTNQVQCTLVWNHTNNDKSNDNTNTTTDINHDDAPIIRRLVQALVAATAPIQPTTKAAAAVEWHSIWSHDNSSGKHNNAIFSHQGAWKRWYCASSSSVLQSSSSSSSLQHVQASGIEEFLSDCGPVPIPLYFPPHVFRQGNLTAFTAIVQSIRTYLKQHYQPMMISSSSSETTTRHRRPKCLELYGGVGTIGLHVADLCSDLVSSDENPYNVPCFEASARILLRNLSSSTAIASTSSVPSGQTKRNDTPSRKSSLEPLVPPPPTIRYESASASRMIELGEHDDVDIIIVDPPRKGLEDSVSAALVKGALSKGHYSNHYSRDTLHPPCCRHQTLVYVSCGFEAFQRDYDILTNAPTTRRGSGTSCPWTFDRAEGHILFPGSNAIETLAFFRRINPRWVGDS